MSTNQSNPIFEILQYADFSQSDLKRLQCYHELLTSNFKKSYQAYHKFEQDRIPK